jgi:16S rRNA (guanine527-N7)-methyltransferase
VADRDLRQRITRRASRAGLSVPAAIGDALAGYLELLARWNRKINLTALTVDPPNEEALDRLIIEPLSAARFITPADRLIIDIGSGGGSPAIPLRLMCPGVRLIMVESKVRKSAFLREVVRQLGMTAAQVENCRYEELLARPELHEAVDIVTLRAVRIEAKTLRATQAFLRPGGRLFLFRSGGAESSLPSSLPALKLVGLEMLVPALGSYIEIIKRT